MFLFLSLYPQTPSGGEKHEDTYIYYTVCGEGVSREIQVMHKGVAGFFFSGSNKTTSVKIPPKIQEISQEWPAFFLCVTVNVHAGAELCRHKVRRESSTSCVRHAGNLEGRCYRDFGARICFSFHRVLCTEGNHDHQVCAMIRGTIHLMSPLPNET